MKIFVLIGYNMKDTCVVLWIKNYEVHKWLKIQIYDNSYGAMVSNNDIRCLTKLY